MAHKIRFVHFIQSIILFPLPFFIMFLSTCDQEEEEIAPIHEGLYLNYRYTLYGPGVNQWLTLILLIDFKVLR
jgi:hypothetical protein